MSVLTYNQQEPIEGPASEAPGSSIEMLHTLGLRENPPSSAEISRQVAERCRG
jgi:hypothetical protein